MVCLETVGRVVNRMAELKGMATQDPMKSDQDVESYNNEFHDLQLQLYQIGQQTFNGASLFADRTQSVGVLRKFLKELIRKITPLTYTPVTMARKVQS